MNEREKIILSVAGGIATLGVSYLVWRHERSIALADAQAQSANTVDQSQANDAATLSALTTSYYPAGGGTSNMSYDNGGSSSLTPAGDSNIESILAAFFGKGGTGNDPSTGTPATLPVGGGGIGGVRAIGPEPAPGGIVGSGSASGVLPVGPEPAPGGIVGSGSVHPVGPQPLPITGTAPNPVFDGGRGVVRPVGPARPFGGGRTALDYVN